MVIAYNYVPTHFLRCHSKTKDSGDVQTQVWHCAFEPSTRDSSVTTSIVATCGGNSVCFIDCTKGEVVNKYNSPKLKDLLYCVCWGVLEVGGRAESLLAAGGSAGIIHLIHRRSNRCLLTHSLPSKSIVSSLMFHPLHPHVLFCATSRGEVQVLSLEASCLDRVGLSPLSCLSGRAELFDMAWSSDMLFVSSAEGLIAFHLPDKASLSLNKEGRTVRAVCRAEAKGGLVDSVEALPGARLAVKYALHGCIYIVSTAALPSSSSGLDEPLSLPLLITLNWSNTDNYFMYMGVSNESGLVCCGDDKGAVWVYDVGGGGGTEPVSVVAWPRLHDPHADKKRKLRLDTYDIVVDKVAVHSNGTFLVAVTSNNMVCIYTNHT